MNKNNLIKLGAFAQRKFKMEKDFKIVEVEDETNRVILPFCERKSFEFQRGYDMVELQKVRIVDGETEEYAWIGYSRKANTLVIKGI